MQSATGLKVSEMGYNPKTGNPHDPSEPLRIIGDEAKNLGKPKDEFGHPLP